MKRLEVLITDFDGVLTDCKKFYNSHSPLSSHSSQSSHMKAYNMKDGQAVQSFHHAGIPVHILSGDDSPTINTIGKRLKYDRITTGVKDKLKFVENLCRDTGIHMEQIGYIGDDMADVRLLSKVGHPYAPSDCNRALRQIPGICILPIRGGEGCLSELYNILYPPAPPAPTTPPVPAPTFVSPLITCCIPARYKSVRLPGKPLLKINAKTVIEHVYRQVQKSKYITNIMVLTEDERIAEEVKSFGGQCTVITALCKNGTERIIEYLKLAQISGINGIVVNVQGDEPFIDPIHVDLCIKNYLDRKHLSPDMVCSTLHYRQDPEKISNRNVGKAVLDKHNNIMYCSRNIIPGTKTHSISNTSIYYGHIGVFVFDVDYLVSTYPGHSPCQVAEDIEWLKILEDGYRVNSVLVENHIHGIDTMEDYNDLLSLATGSAP